RDFLTRSFQLPFSFNRLASGPGLAFFLKWLKLPVFFLLLTISSVLALLLKWLPVHQAFSFGRLYHGYGAFAIVHRSVVPQKIELPEIGRQLLGADVVIDADQAPANESLAAFRSVNVSVATGIFKRAVTDGLVTASPSPLEPAIGRKFIGHQFGAG